MDEKTIEYLRNVVLREADEAEQDPVVKGLYLESLLDDAERSVALKARVAGLSRGCEDAYHFILNREWADTDRHGRACCPVCGVSQFFGKHPQTCYLWLVLKTLREILDPAKEEPDAPGNTEFLKSCRELGAMFSDEEWDSFEKSLEEVRHPKCAHCVELEAKIAGLEKLLQEAVDESTCVTTESYIEWLGKVRAELDAAKEKP